MRVIEQLIIPKRGVPELCEDGVFVTDHFAAVVDGATDKNSRRYEGMAGGRFAMQIVGAAVGELPPDADALDAVRALSSALAARIPADVPQEERPSAAVTVFSARRREIWQVGDVGFWFEGCDVAPPLKPVERIVADFRVAVLKAALLAGADPADLALHDIGRQATMPLLTRLLVFVNNEQGGDLAYGAIDGHDVPSRLTGVTSVPESVSELVLATDGYPVLRPTLAEAEETVLRLMAEDPLCIGPLAGTKGVAPGALGFDDRGYLRLAVGDPG